MDKYPDVLEKQKGLRAVTIRFYAPKIEYRIDDGIRLQYED